MLHPEHLRALLLSCLMAAGCGEIAYEDFAEERNALHCDIRELCDPEANPEAVCYVVQTDTPASCRWYRPVKGQACLDAMVEASNLVEDDPSTCEDWTRSDNPLPECAEDEVTRRRRGLSCAIDGVTLGRPLREHGTPMLASIIGRTSPPDHPSPQQTAAQGWIEVARHEHASVATFSRLGLDLMHLGAPLELVQRCHEAALDEARHAHAALAVVVSLGGDAVRFGALPSVAHRAASLQQVALEALVEGCWGEGIASAVAGVAAERSSGQVRQVLRTIATEEAAHAELAWATLRWATERDPRLLDLLLDEASRHDPPSSQRVALAEPAFIEGFGLLGAAEAAEIRRQTLRGVVLPVLRAMRVRATVAAAAA